MSFILHKISFEKDNEKQEFKFERGKELKDIVFSMIIGTNGIGKSLFLSKVVDIFRDIENRIKEKDSRIKFNYYLIEYEIDNIKYMIEKDGSSYIHSVETWDKIKLPETILALSFLPEDKFVYQGETDNENSMYKYLGIRSTGNAFFLGSIDKRIESILFDNIENEEFQLKLATTFNLLNYEPKILLKYDATLKSMITSNITLKTINGRIETKIRNSKFDDKEIDRIYSNNEIKKGFLQYIKKVKKSWGNKKNIENNSFTEFTIDFTKSNNFLDEYTITRDMVTATLLEKPRILISRKNSNLGFGSLSSGEKNLLYITLHILANVKDNSLIIIDEPEINLHPNWQLDYNSHLKKILAGFKNIHIMIATHSHFMISGLNKDEANIFAIDRNKTVENIESDIYGWSAENILYKIFHVRTVNNSYIEKDLNKILDLISDKNNDNAVEVKKIYERLKEIVFDDNDPLRIILEKINKYLLKHKV